MQMAGDLSKGTYSVVIQCSGFDQPIVFKWMAEPLELLNKDRYINSDFKLSFRNKSDSLEKSHNTYGNAQ